MRVLRYRHTGILVENLNAAVSFYRKLAFGDVTVSHETWNKTSRDDGGREAPN